MERYRIYDLQVDKYKWDWQIFSSLWDVVDNLIDYHDIDFDSDEKWRDLEKYLQDLYWNNINKKLVWLKDYWEWEIEVYKEDNNKLYCDVCQTAYVELNREKEEDDFYCCSICREQKTIEQKNNFSENYDVIDYYN